MKSRKKPPKKRRIKFEFEGEQGEIEYSLIRAVEQWDKHESRIDDPQTRLDAIADILSGVITDWNLLDEDEGRLPINAAAFDGLPIELVILMFEEIGKDLNYIARTYGK
jgi:hypothetical protein